MSDKPPPISSNPSSKMMLPALPRINTVQGPSRSQMSSSPMRPSPLRESTTTGFESLTVSSAPGSTPLSDHKAKSAITANALAERTPPDSAGPVIVDGSRAVNGSHAAATGDMGAFRYGEGFQSAQWQESAEFVQSGRTRSPDDPFVSTPARSDLTAGPAAANAITQVTAHSVTTVQTPETAFSPRVDRLGEPISARNAQGLLSPQACVFVANLSNQRTDDQLELSVHNAFSIFGACHIKIRRDKNKMPFAFVQFENVEDARIAIREAGGTRIDGRPIRAESAKVQRSVYLTRLTGGAITDGEARGVLEMFGAIEETCPITVADQQLFGLPEGIWVKFAFFQDCRDAIVAFRHHDHYRLTVHHNEELRQRLPVNVSPSPQRSPRRPRQISDARSIYVGNLPPGTSEAQLVQVFGQYGRVISASVLQKELPGNRTNTFAFIGFQTAREAQMALGTSINIGGWPIRIEAKEYTMRRNVRLGNTPPSTDNQQSQILSTLYQQALEMGLSHESAARILSVGRRAGASAGASSYVNASPMSSYGTSSPAGSYGSAAVMTSYGSSSPMAGYGSGSPMDTYIQAQYSSPAYGPTTLSTGLGGMSSPTPMGHIVYPITGTTINTSSNQYATPGPSSYISPITTSGGSGGDYNELSTIQEQPEGEKEVAEHRLANN